MAFFRRRTPPNPMSAGTVEPPEPIFQLGSLRLYQPDDELRVRLPNGVGEVVAYTRTLTWTCNELLSRLGQDFGSMGIFIAVGIKPSGQVRIWCEQVGGALPSDVWPVLTALLDGAGAGVRPQVTAPVAFALEGLVGAGPSAAFPEFPSAWVNAMVQSDQPVTVPDGLFDLVFAD
jgi:hypothetical protein